MIQNRKLSRAIADASWSKFATMLEYKAAWYGRTITKCSPWYPSSQIYSSCGTVIQKKALYIRSWDCACGVTHDRDVNAAMNILTAGLAEYPLSGLIVMLLARYGTVKQESSFLKTGKKSKRA